MTSSLPQRDKPVPTNVDHQNRITVARLNDWNNIIWVPETKRFVGLPPFNRWRMEIPDYLYDRDDIHVAIDTLGSGQIEDLECWLSSIIHGQKIPRWRATAKQLSEAYVRTLGGEWISQRNVHLESALQEPAASACSHQGAH